MGEGRPVTLEFMNDLVRNYSEVHNGTPCGMLPSNLLYCDTRKGLNGTYGTIRRKDE